MSSPGFLQPSRARKIRGAAFHAFRARHGEASPLFLIGGGVKGGLYGTLPDLSATNMGNVRYTTDFRSVYATVLERWLGRPSTKILSGNFDQLPIIA